MPNMTTPGKSNYKRNGANLSQAKGRAVYQMTGADKQKSASKADYVRKANTDVKKVIGGGDTPLPKPAAANKGNYPRKISGLAARTIPLLRQKLTGKQ